MAEPLETFQEVAERKETAMFILGVGSLGFSVVGLVSLLLSPRYHGNLTGLELLVAGAMGIAVAIFLVVALLAIRYDKAWFDQ